MITHSLANAVKSIRAVGSNPRARSSLLESALLTAVVLAGVVAISPNVADPDLWGHVRYGRDLLAGGLPTTTTYSYVAAEQTWVNHENVMEVALALGADYLGPIGMVVGKMLLGLVLLLTVVYQCRQQRARLMATSLLVLLPAVGLAHYWSLRPQLFSFVAYAAMLALLAWCFAGWEGMWRFKLPQSNNKTTPIESESNTIPLDHHRLIWLWCVPLLMIAWTNAHGGFLAGGAIFCVYLAIRSLEVIAHGTSRARGLVKRFVLMIFATMAATFLNPYGYNFHLWLFDDLRVPRPEITEWLPPSWSDPQTLPFVLLAALFAFTLLRSRRSWDAAHLAILVATLWQAVEHQRHIPFFALSVAFFLPRHLQSALTSFATTTENPAPSVEKQNPVSRSVVLAWGGAACVVACLLGWKLVERGSDLKVPRDYYPVSAMEFMAQHRLQGRVLCTFNWAQYLLGTFENDVQVQVDGRCRTAYSQAMLDEHFDFLFGDQPASQRYREPHSAFNPTRVLTHGQPALVLIDRGQPHSVEVMQAQSRRWVLLYQDSLAQLWGRRDQFDDPRSPAYFPDSQRNITEAVQQGSVTWPADPTSEETKPQYTNAASFLSKVEKR